MAGRSGGGRSGGGSRGGGGGRSSMGRSSSGRSMGSRGSSGRSFSSLGSNRGSSSSRGNGGLGGGLGGGGFGGGSSGRPGGFHHSPPPRAPRPPRRSYGGFNGGSFLGGYLFGRSTNRSYGNPSGVPYGTGDSYQPRQRRSSGCLSKILVFLILFVILYLILSFGGRNSGTSGNVTQNTIKREALEKGNVIETKYYEDQIDWISSETTLTKGLKNFYNLTGIQPFILLVDSVGSNPSDDDIDDYANAYYDKHFKDEAHLLYLYIEDIDYMYGIVGSAGKTIMNQEAWDILFDTIQKYWTSDMDEDSLFSKAFDEAAKNIMSDPNAGTKMKTSVIKTLLVVITVIIVVIIIRSIYQQRLEQKRKESDDLKEILNKPLESFKDSEMDDLEKKYDK